MVVNKKTFILKKLIIPLLLAIYLLSTSSSCKKTPVTEFNKEFPNTIGTWWKYKVYDSINSQLDTITITIVGSAKLSNGETATIWQIKSLFNIVDTNYVYSGNNIVIDYHYKDASTLLKKYIFPLNIGSNWVNLNYADTSKVTLKNAINVIAGNFTESYLIKRDYKSFPGYNVFKEDEFFVPNVGVVKKSIFVITLGTLINQNWELVSYLKRQ